MSLASWMLETSLGTRAKAPLSVALFRGGAEITVPGYERQAVPRWRLTDRSASASLTFGPYQGAAVFDRYVIFSGDEAIEEIPEESEASLPRGFTWEWKPEFILGA